MKKLFKDKLFITAVICLSIVAISAAVSWAALARRKAAAPPPTPAPTASPAPTPTPSPSPTPVPTPTPEPYFAPPELAESQAVNPDVVAWLDIPGTAVHYPILLHPTEDNYYLDVTIDGGGGYPGSIYINSMEGRDFDTFNTVIYGHNMANGSYFGSLKNYWDADYLAAHREIDIYTPTAAHRYLIFAVVCYDDRYITAAFHDEVEAEREAFLLSLRECGAEIPEELAVTADSHLITLSTCVGGMPNNRLLIVAVEQEK